MKTETVQMVEKYKDSIFKIAFNICKNVQDAEDVTQETFVQYHTTNNDFENEEHIKAWLIRVAINKSKNIVKSFWKTKGMPLEDYIDTLTFENNESRCLLEEVMKLPEKYRIVIHLFYYEDYSVKEIANIMSITESNVKVRLNRARKLLKLKLQEGWLND